MHNLICPVIFIKDYRRLFFEFSCQDCPWTRCAKAFYKGLSLQSLGNFESTHNCIGKMPKAKSVKKRCGNMFDCWCQFKPVSVPGKQKKVTHTFVWQHTILKKPNRTAVGIHAIN